jgi:hypothetical protein
MFWELTSGDPIQFNEPTYYFSKTYDTDGKYSETLRFDIYKNGTFICEIRKTIIILVEDIDSTYQFVLQPASYTADWDPSNKVAVNSKILINKISRSLGIIPINTISQINSEKIQVRINGTPVNNTLLKENTSGNYLYISTLA